jgi:uncharacterized OsmC-like protein
MSNPVGQFTMHIEEIEGYRFRTRFDKAHYADLLTDEPKPLSQDTAPNPARILGAAVGNCLIASLKFCLSKAGIELDELSGDVTVQLTRNEDKRLRIGSIDVTLHPRLTNGAGEFSHCLDIFEDFCVVTESVRKGLDVKVHVETEPHPAQRRIDAAE